MKTKTLVAMAALALLVALPARAAEVISSNTVGYQKLTINANGYTLLANPFVIVGSDSDEPYPINQMFTGDTNSITAGVSATRGDQMQTWNPDGSYTTYFFSSRIAGKAWAEESDSRTPVTEAFEPGDGFWYLNRSNQSFELIVSGQVGTNSVSVTLNPGYTLVCNPFPADLSLNEGGIDWSSVGSSAGVSATRGDQIQTWNADGSYNTFFFSSRISGNGWADESDSRTPTSYAIPSGAGFWYLNRKTTPLTLVLESPL